jgi:hypothetical protein
MQGAYRRATRTTHTTRSHDKWGTLKFIHHYQPRSGQPVSEAYSTAV